jgi:hypothetical protein
MKFRNFRMLFPSEHFGNSVSMGTLIYGLVHSSQILTEAGNTLGTEFRWKHCSQSAPTCIFAPNNCYTIVQCCQEAGRLPEPHHNTTPSPLTHHKDRAICCLYCLNVASVPCKTGERQGKFILHAPVAAAAYQDEWAASLVRAGRSCFLPLVPLAILLLLLYLSGGSNGRKNPTGG